MDNTMVDVEIHGRTYNLLSDDNPAVIRNIAAYVDDKMRQIGETTHTADTTRIAILAALNITSELFDSRQSDGRHGATPSAGSHVRDEELSRLLDEVLIA